MEHPRRFAFTTPSARTTPEAPARSALLRRALALSCAAILATAAHAGNPPVVAPSITEASLHRHVRFLADRELEGRRAGTEGAALAAAYIETRFKAAGLSPGGTSGYDQPFRVASRGRELELANVLAVLPGRDDDLSGQYVLLGAHLDHLGRRGDRVFHGADDNASGCAVLLEVAAALAGDGGCRRSFLFVAFDGEEMGLRGSRHFAENPTVDPDAIVAMINLDMVSRGETGDLRVCGTKDSLAMKRAVERAAGAAGLTLHYDKESEWRRSSDHSPFADRKIPWLYFGVLDHEDYHRPTDTADKSNRQKMLRVARLTYLTLREIGNAEPPPTFDG